MRGPCGSRGRGEGGLHRYGNEDLGAIGAVSWRMKGHQLIELFPNCLRRRTSLARRLASCFRCNIGTPSKRCLAGGIIAALGRGHRDASV